MEPLSSNVAESDEPFEPCPTPLSWKDVLREFGAQSEDWTTTVDGLTVKGRSIGEGPPLYLLSGMTGDSDMLGLTVWLLRENFRCVLFDWPSGFRPRHATDISRLLFAIADARGDDVFSMFATGFGSMGAFAAINENPARIRKAVFHGAFAKCQLSLAERVAISVGRLLPGSIGSIPGVARILQQNHRGWFPPFDESRWSFAEENLSRTPIAALARLAGCLKTFDTSDQLASIGGPTMLVRCEGDGPTQVAAQDLLEQSIPGVSVQWLHTCGRLPFLTHPHRLKRILIDFLVDDSDS